MAHEKKQVDVTTWALPEGAIARLGQGYMAGVTFSMDESTIALWSRLGVWLYDVSTLTPLMCWIRNAVLLYKSHFPRMML